VCVILGSSGIYYAYFTIVLLAVASLYRIVEQRSIRRTGSAAILALTIVAAIAVNLMPNLLHFFADGRNPEVAARAPFEAEIYSLKMTQLVLPVTGHRIPWLAGFKAAYNGTPLRTPISEGDGAALGACFAAGFGFLLLTLITGYPGSRHRALIQRLGRLNLCAFLLGTLGGVGSILAWTISPEIRAYARMGIFISFFAAMAVAAVLDEIRHRWVRPGLYSWMFRGALAAILVAGILDQTTSANVPLYQHASEQYHNDAEFAARAEGLLPHGAMILQLPFVGFPEYTPPRAMAPYDHLRPYLHSVSLRWSYGAMKGRFWDAWQSDLLSRPIEDVLEAAAVAGFGGLYIDRNGYADRGAAIQTSLRSAGLTSIESPNGRLWIYDIRPYAARLRAEYGPREWALARDAVLDPLVLRWLPQCSSLAGTAGRNWRWCGSHAGLMVENASGHARRIEIYGALDAAAAGECNVRMGGPGWTETFPVSNTTLAALRHTLEVPPGTSVFRLISDCPRLLSTADPRVLVFRVDDFGAALPDTPPTPELGWKGGFYGLETGAGKTWHWCTASGELVIRNPGATSEVSLSMRLAAAPGVTGPLSIIGPGFTRSVAIGPVDTLFSKRLAFPPGDTVIRFSSQATPVTVGSDPRKFVFRVEDLRFGDPLLVPHLIQVN
jgi:phosphoglycerol transferase